MGVDGEDTETLQRKKGKHDPSRSVELTNKTKRKKPRKRRNKRHPFFTTSIPIYKNFFLFISVSDSVAEKHN